MAAAPQKAQYTPDINNAARNYVLANALDEWQNIYTATFTSGANTVINIPLRNVGLVKRLIIEIAATVSGSAGVTHTLTNLGSSTFLSNVTLTDLSNQTRINTTGWHLTAVASAKARMPFGSAITATDTPFGYGNNFLKTQGAPATITNTAAANNVFVMYEVPIAYNDFDLRGAIYANVVNATFNLQLTVNPNLLVANTVTDAIQSMYQSSSAVVATLPSFTINVYQNYLDQLPTSNGNVILPLLDLAANYLLLNTTTTGIVANQDFPIPYANFRDFMSTTVIYDNAGVLNAGTDINSFSLQSANYTNIWKIDPYLSSLWNRLRMQCDFPKGMYYFDSRMRPVSTIQYGNMQLIINPSAVTAGATFLIGYESLAYTNQITQAGSLYGN